MISSVWCVWSILSIWFVPSVRSIWSTLLRFGREGFPQVQILEDRSASAKPLRETPSPCDHLPISVIPFWVTHPPSVAPELILVRPSKTCSVPVFSRDFLMGNLLPLNRPGSSMVALKFSAWVSTILVRPVLGNFTHFHSYLSRKLASRAFRACGYWSGSPSLEGPNAPLTRVGPSLSAALRTEVI
jgi:hypothetical protein